LGPYAYSTINVKLETLQNDPDSVKLFVAGMEKGLQFVRDHKEESLDIAKKEFPTMSDDLLKATLDRSYADQLWEYSGQITKESVATNLAVVKNAGMLKSDIAYDQIIDTKFVQKK
jgi:NitT/TauT family transport system substrate-binding protein